MPPMFLAWATGRMELPSTEFGKGGVVSVGEAVLWETIKSESCALGRHLGPLSEQNKQRLQHLPLQSSARWGTKM